MNETDPTRPDPEALLNEVQRERHGALKIFLGAYPGVGKTYKMLEAAREARREGLDVVIGVVEAHGREETQALCEGIERVPLATVEYRGSKFSEFDLDAVMRRAPSVVLVDELAHRNIPGTRHGRRYQDIEELLERGIDVWTTVNIQHVESLNDAVARITGVRMRETVPDELLSQARDVVLVDLTPRELIERLKQGKVYVPEQARAAMEGFFSPTNLAALRELAVQAVADRLDLDVRETMRREGIQGPWPVRDRIVVAVDGIGNAGELVRFGCRLAERRRAPWHVVYIDTGDVDAAQRASVDRAFELAERLGALTTTLRGSSPVAELLDFARSNNATTLVVGRSHHRPFAGLFGRTLSQRLLRRGGEFEITFVPSRAKRRRDARTRVPRLGRLHHYRRAVLALTAATAVALVVDPLLPLANLSLIYLLAVLWVAVGTAVGPAMVTALAAAAAYNFLFTEPRYTFAMTRGEEILTVGFFLLMGLIGGRLAGRLRSQVLALRSTNQQNQALLSLNRRLAAAVDMAGVYRETVTALEHHLHRPVVFMAPGDDGAAVEVDRAGQAALDGKARSAAQWAMDNQQPSGFLTDTLSSADWRFLPLVFEDRCHGVVGVRRPEDGDPTHEQLSAIDALVSQVTLALARTRLAGSLEQAKVAEETERLRSALLSSVSHDLRTPLASMIGAASTLRSLDGGLSDEDRRELLDSVITEGERLDRYIQNLLDMTRLGHGTLKLERDWIGLDDIVNSALRRTRALLQGLRVETRLQPELPLLYVHPALIEQALVNVIENAAKFSPRKSVLQVSGQRIDNEIRIDVTDQGPGIPEAQRKQVFDMFFTDGKGDRSKSGSGLGLAICGGMIGAHQGRIEAVPGPGGRGTTISIYLPLIEPPSQADAEAGE